VPDRAPADSVAADEHALATWRARFVHASLSGYLDTASHAPQAIDHAHALHEYLASWRTGSAPWGVAWQLLHDEVASRTAALVGAAAGSVTLVPSASHALLGVLSAIAPDGDRDTIVVSEREWVSSRHVLEADGRFRIVVVSSDRACDDDGFLARIDGRTRLVVVSQVCFRTGAHVDVARVSGRAQAAGALVFCDVYQAVGATDVAPTLRASDFAAGGYLKHLLGGPGVAWLYVRPDLADALSPRLTGWRGQRQPMQPTLDPAAGALRFAAGTWPVPSLYVARAGLGLIEAAGPARIAAQVARLAARFADRCRAAGIDVVTPPTASARGPLVVVRVPHAERVQAALAARGVVVTARDGTLRASFHAHLRLADVDDACAALSDALETTKEPR
jgi:selenocysteine lyase/cysteine desulfurase